VWLGLRCLILKHRLQPTPSVLMLVRVPPLGQQPAPVVLPRPLEWGLRRALARWRCLEGLVMKVSSASSTLGSLSLERLVDWLYAAASPLMILLSMKA
jgi:hypothetical protein